MALTNNGTKVSIPAAQLPSGYTKPSVTEFSDYEMKYSSRVFTIAKSTVENEDAVTTMENLIAQLNAEIETLISSDIDTVGLTVTAWSELRSLSTNNNLAGVKFTNGALNYILVVDIFVKTA
jgi:hypothetical protein